jgi:hypothetical protein
MGISGILLGTGRGAQIDAHNLVIHLENINIAGYATDVGAKTSISFVNSNILNYCAVRSSITTLDCSCHPYGRVVPIWPCTWSTSHYWCSSPAPPPLPPSIASWSAAPSRTPRGHSGTVAA